MVELTHGNLLEAEVEALVNAVNCVGVMGKGIALKFRQGFPENFKFYEAACRNKEMRPGKVLVFETGRLTGPRFIINFPTKSHWRGKSRIEYIDSGLESLVDEIRRRKIESVAVPPLGCGLGGLRWNSVRPRIMRAFRELPNVRVLLFEPGDAPKAEKIAKEESRQR